jgi:hypothetical protein
MITVTDNSVQQINAALLSIKQELGSTGDTVEDLVSLKVRIDSLEDNVKSIYSSLNDLRTQIANLPSGGSSGGSSTPSTPNTPSYYEQNFTGSVTYDLGPTAQHIAIGTLDRVPNSIISIEGTVTHGSNSEPISSMSPYISGSTLYITTGTYIGRSLVTPEETTVFNVTVKYT